MTKINNLKAYAIDIEYAQLESLRRVIETWKQQDTHPSMLQAVVKKLSGSEVFRRFLADIGRSADESSALWQNGRDLPSEKMSLVYLELIASKIAEYLPVLKKEQEDTLNPPEKPEGGDNNKSSLPCRKILKFELPDGMDGGTPLGAVKDYLGLGTRIVVCLQNSNIDTAKDLANPGGERQTWSQYFGRTPNFGVKSTNKLYHFMVERGFKPVFVED